MSQATYGGTAGGTKVEPVAQLGGVLKDYLTRWRGTAVAGHNLEGDATPCIPLHGDKNKKVVSWEIGLGGATESSVPQEVNIKIALASTGTYQKLS